MTGVRRSSASSVLFSTYNLFDLSSPEGPHYEAVIEVIRSLDTDVLAVQEVLAPEPDTAAERLRRLAAGTGMHCDVPCGGTPAAALALGGHGYHVGLLWRDGIEPVPDSLRCLGGRDFWHALAQVTLDVGGTLVRHASFHAAPFGRDLRVAQNERLVAAITRPPGRPPALVGADWNTECADRVRPTTGHHPADVYAAHGVRRRVDAVRVTAGLRQAMLGYEVWASERAAGASDHLPVTVEYAVSRVIADLADLSSLRPV